MGPDILKFACKLLVNDRARFMGLRARAAHAQARLRS